MTQEETFLFGIYIYFLLQHLSFFSKTNHHGTVQGCQKLWLKEASWGKVLRVPLLVPGTGGSKLIVRKDFRSVIHMQVGALLRVPSGYSILSCFSCRWDFIDNTWAWILGQAAQNEEKRENLSPLPHFCTSTPIIWALSHLHLGACSQFLFLLHWGTCPTEVSLLLHSILSLNILKRSTAWQPAVCESEIKMLFPFPLCDPKLEILICLCGLFILTWSSATQYFFILDCVGSCSPCGTKNYAEQKL